MIAWFADLTPRERRTMGACFGGWSLDALDVQIFSFVIPVCWRCGDHRGRPGNSPHHPAGLRLGGWLAGALSDRYGRVASCR